MNKKKLAVLLVLLGIVGTGTYMVMDTGSPVKKPAAGPETLETLQQDEASSMTMDNLDISQGEKGEVLWNLKADAANMLREDETILVRNPRLVYFLPEKRGQVLVVSKNGVVDQRNDKMRFESSVKSTHEDNELLSELLEYDGSRRVLHSPDKAEFSNLQMNGTSNSLDWELDEQVLTADGDVVVNWNMVPKDSDMNK